MHRSRTWSTSVMTRRTQRNRILPVSGSDGSTLTLDFTSGPLDTSKLTFTRTACTCTFVNSLGYVETVTSANTPRFDYDPVTNQCRGLLMEPEATNLLNGSQSFATSGGTNNNWTDTSITRTTGQADPANGATAIRFTASAGNATVISSAAIGTSAERTFSIWLRRVTGTGNIQFTTNNGTTWTTQAITSSWVRYTFPATTEAQQVGIRIVTSADAIEMWGAQLEAGTGASSYIPTTTSTVTRLVESMSMTNLSSLGFSTTAGTFLMRGFQTKRATTTAYPRTFRFVDATSNEPLAMPVNGLTLFASSRNSTGTVFSEVTRTNSLSQEFKIAGSFESATGIRASLNGSSVQGSVTNAANLGTATSLIFNSNSTTTDYAGMVIKYFKYWPISKTASELNALTA